jgi:hypothetical protein
MPAGDVCYEFGFWTLPSSKAAASSIAKGEVVDLSQARRCAQGDTGPFGVALEAIPQGADMRGRVLMKGVVYVAAGGAVGALSYVRPGDGGAVLAAQRIAVTVPSGEVAVTSTAAQPNLVESGSIPGWGSYTPATVGGPG